MCPDPTRPVGRLSVVAIAACTALLLGGPAPAVEPVSPHPRYRLQASLSLTAPQIDGTVDVTLTNSSIAMLHEVVFFLFPNRFSIPDTGINDFNRPFVYPQEDFAPGAMSILAAADAGASVPIETMRRGNLPDGCVVRLPIAPLAPGATRTITLRFQTVVPYRFGAFGTFEDQLTAIGGWYPYLAALDADGTWRLDAPPALAEFDVTLTVPLGLDVLLNGNYFSNRPFLHLHLDAVHYLALVAAPRLLRTETRVGGTPIVLWQREPTHRTSRVSVEPSPTQILLTTLEDIVAQRPRVVPLPATEVVVVEAPLRLDLTASGEGMTVISDRALKVHWLLRPFHEAQVAQGIYAELMRPALARREPGADYWWVGEGLAHMLGRRFTKETRPGTRSVQDWINLFNIFSIVDRFESAPKIPFVDAFFARARVADPLHQGIATFNRTLPPGHVILGKLHEVLGDGVFDAVIDRCSSTDLPFRACATAVAGDNLDWLFTQWLRPYPALNYDFTAIDLNRAAEHGFRHTVTVERRSSRPIVEPVTVRLRSIGGRTVDLHWEGRGDTGQVVGETPGRMWQAIIDPERKLIEDRRDDNFQPPSPQVVLDTADVEISSTEFGISGLLVGRNRYDYRKDLAAAGFYTNRGIGLTSGARAHWGTRIDPTLYAQNLYVFYGYEALDRSFRQKQHPEIRTTGQLASLGARYDYSNVLAFENPTHQSNLRLYADWYDRDLGSDFNYVDWGAQLALTHPLWTYRSIGALQVIDGFSEPLGRSLVPNQGLYSLGGALSIRGIGAEEELGRNIFLVRSEVRHDLYPELDMNLLDVLVLRRTQLRLFADSGRVGNSAGRVYDVSGFAVGAGTGFAAVYDFMGFFPAVAYIEMATRVDNLKKASDVQFLFGTRQAF